MKRTLDSRLGRLALARFEHDLDQRFHNGLTSLEMHTGGQRTGTYHPVQFAKGVIHARGSCVFDTVKPHPNDTPSRQMTRDSLLL